MIKFPEQTIVSVSSATLVAGQGAVSVRMDGTGVDINDLLTVYGRRLHDFELSSPLWKDTALLGVLEGSRIRLRVSDQDLDDLGAMADALRKTNPVFYVRADGNIVKMLNFITSFNFRVHIEASESAEAPDALDKALDFYLRNPLLQVPVEPFHTLLQHQAKDAGFTLWDTELENVSRNFYVNDKAQVTVSARWDAQDRHFCTLKDDWEAITSSALFKELESFKQGLFRKKAQCIFCAHLNLCGGYLRAVVPDWPCENWIAVFSKLAEEAQKAKELLNHYPVC